MGAFSSVTIDPAAFAVTKSATGTVSLALKPAPAPGSFPGDVSWFNSNTGKWA
jgi:hypothetical protein